MNGRFRHALAGLALIDLGNVEVVTGDLMYGSSQHDDGGAVIGSGRP